MFLPATTTAALLDRSLPPIREDQSPGPTPRTRHQDAGRDDNRGATRRVPPSNPRRSDSGSHPSRSSSRRGTAHSSTGQKDPSQRQPQSRESRSLRSNPARDQIPGPVPPLPSSSRERTIHHRAELPNPPREDQGPSPPAGLHAFTCSRPGVTFPSPPYNRNSTQ